MIRWIEAMYRVFGVPIFTAEFVGIWISLNKRAAGRVNAQAAEYTECAYSHSITVERRRNSAPHLPRHAPTHPATHSGPP